MRCHKFICTYLRCQHPTPIQFDNTTQCVTVKLGDSDTFWRFFEKKHTEVTIFFAQKSNGIPIDLRPSIIQYRALGVKVSIVIKWIRKGVTPTLLSLLYISKWNSRAKIIVPTSFISKVAKIYPNHRETKIYELRDY